MTCAVGMALQFASFSKYSRFRRAIYARVNRSMRNSSAS